MKNTCHGCPYILRVDSRTNVCIWNGRENPSGCNDGIVAIQRITTPPAGAKIERREE